MLGRRRGEDFDPARAMVVLRRKEGWKLMARERIARRRSGEGAESILADFTSSLDAARRALRSDFVEGRIR